MEPNKERASARPIHEPSTRHIPSRIAQAMSKAVLETTELGLVERQVLALVVYHVEKNDPGRPVPIRRSNFAASLGISEPQVRRYLARLEDAGWLRRQQEISRERGAQVGTVQLTEKALRTLFPPDPVDNPALANDRNDHNAQGGSRSGMSDAFMNSPLEKCLRRKDARDRPSCDTPRQNEGGPSHPDGHERGRSEGDHEGCGRRPPPSRDPEVAKRKIPEELRWLAELMSPFGVFKLMSLAKARQTTLQVVLSVTRDAVASARNAYAYLAGVLAEERDWGIYAQRRAAAIERDRKREEAREKAALERRALASLDGRAFANPATGRVFEVLGGILTVFSSLDDWRRGFSLGARPASEDFLSAVRGGRLVPAA